MKNTPLRGRRQAGGEPDPALGPSPVAQRAQDGELRAGGARGRVLRAVADAGGGTVRDLAERLGGHPNGIREHLEHLRAHGLVARTPVPAAGRGRPSHRYAVTSRGAAALEPGIGEAGVAAGESGLLAALGDYLGGRGDAAAEARAVGRAWGERLVERLPQLAGGSADAEAPAGVGPLRALLEVLGFSPRVVGPTATDGGPTVLALRTCPMLAEARANPAVVCRVHQGMVAGAHAALGGAAGVELQPFAEPGACRLVLGAG